ncbi:hypothetical protein [Lachnospira multipara]|nr:hypothetical protein [Lachnospira multipara]
MECKCIDCPNKCHEYNNNYVSDKSYYEWSIKLDKCKKENKVTYARTGVGMAWRISEEK